MICSPSVWSSGAMDGEGKEDCWRVYSIVTDLYKPLPERFRDFISVPKSNGYQSLHTTVLGGRRTADRGSDSHAGDA